MPFPESFLDEVIEKNDIVSVVSEYVNLSRRSGSNIFGLCPFHSERTPSFSVSESKQIYHCFGCGKGGGVINFIMEIENLGYRDAVQKLADRAGIPMPEEEYDPDSKLRARIYAANKAAARWFHEQLLAPSGKAARDYVSARKLTKSTCTNFGLGFAPDSWNGLRSALNAEGFSDKELFLAGLLSKSQKDENSYFDKFRNRLMFPVIDVRGNVIAFSGRALGDSGPKYYNSPDTKIFNKGRNLFGLNRAKNSKSDYFILVEGNVDVVTLHQAGFDSAVASLGTAFTEQQAQLLSRYKNQVILAYDGDTAGVNATSKAMRILDKLDVKVRVLRMPGAKDPDEYIKLNGADSFRRLIEESENRTDYRLRLIESKYDLSLTDQKAAYIVEAEKFTATLRTQAERQLYCAVVAEKAGVRLDAVISDVEKERLKLEKRAKTREQRESLSAVSVRKYSNPASAASEEGIIRILSLVPSLISLPDLPEPSAFSDEKLASIYSALLERLRNGESISFPSLSSELDNECISLLVSIDDKPENVSAARKTLLQYIGNLGNAKKSGWENIDEIIKAKQNQ